MFILMFFLVVAISQYLTNYILGIDADNEDSYEVSNKDSLILAIIFLSSIILQITTSVISFLSDIFWWLCLLYIIVSSSVMLVITMNKKTRIEKQREEIQQVYDILQRMVDRKNEGLDFNNVPFTLGYKYDSINKIDVQVEPINFDEKILSVLLQQLNAFLPSFTWNYELHLENRYMTFIGLDKPPILARWQGSWLRNFKYMPVGISGEGEVAWQPDDINKSKLGRSQYLDDNGEPIPANTKIPAQPQCLVAGATGGGKSIFIHQKL